MDKQCKLTLQISVYFLLLALHFSVSRAQEPDILWEETYGGIDGDGGYSVQQTSEGGYIIAGYTESFGSGASDIYVIKTDADGDILWTKTFGGVNNEYSWEVQETVDNGFTIVGNTNSFGIGAPDSSNIYCIKIDANGDTVWTKIYGGLASEEGHSVQQTIDGGYIIAGWTASHGAGGCDVYLIKTDANGDTLWTKTYGGILNDQSLSVRQTSDSGYVVVGRTMSFGAGLNDVYLIKTNSIGDTLWTRTYGGSYNDAGYSVQQTTDGGYIITGGTYSFGVGSPNHSNVYLIKTDIDGDTLWTKTYDEVDYDWSISVQQTLDEGYIIVGYTYSDIFYESQVYLIKTNTDGDILWVKRHGGEGHDFGRSVQQTFDGGYVIAGLTESFGSGSWDVYLIRTNPLKLISPDGGEEWAAGSVHEVNWWCENTAANSFCLLFSTDGGSSYFDTIAAAISPDSISWSWRLPIIANTTCRVQILTLDSLNNIIAEDASNSNFSIVDLTPPIQFSLLAPIDSSILSNPRPTFVWKASFDSTSGLENYEVYVNDTLRHIGTDTTFTPHDDFADGYYNWYVTAYDSAGNSRQSNETWTVIIDTTPPSIDSLISPTNYGYLTDSVVNFIWHEAYDNLSGIDHYSLQYALNNTFTQGLVETTVVDTTFATTLSDTMYYWRVKAVDVAMNESELSSIWHFYVEFEGDTSAPIAPTLLSPINGIILNDTLVYFEWTVVTCLRYFVGNESTKIDNIKNSKLNILSSPVRYIIQIDTLPDFVSPMLIDTLDTTSTTVVLYEYFPFYWHVKAYDWAGNQGPYSYLDSFGIDVGPLIESTTVWTDTSFAGPFEIFTHVVDNVSAVDSVILHYKRNEDSVWCSTTMQATGVPNWYLGSIPEVVTFNDTVWYYVEAVDNSGNIATDPPGAPSYHYSFIANHYPGIKETQAIAEFFSFHVNGNLSREEVIFHLFMPKVGIVTLFIYDACGRFIDRPIVGRIQAGIHEIAWAANASAGVYFYVLESPWQRNVGKLVLIK